MAPAPAGVVEKSRFEPSVYAQVATAKYGDHLPLHRQEQIHARNRIPLSRSTMCDMMRDLAILLRVVLQEMCQGRQRQEDTGDPDHESGCIMHRAEVSFRRCCVPGRRGSR
jgi:transposase